jgi:4,5-DOPA dioxygenase extradiol
MKKAMKKATNTLFISHGAPDLVLSQDPAVEAIRGLATQRAKPDAIVMVSAHWIDDPIGITSGKQLATIHDFGGFSDALYQIQYPAMGNEALAQEIQQHLQQNGLEGKLHTKRGLDHGAWVPLKIMYPEADVPVVQVSLPAGRLNDFASLGKALSPLREHNILIIGSGGSVHNLRALAHNGATENWVLEFENWLLETIEGNHFERLITPAEFPQSFQLAHPSIEHYAPLVVAWAAADTQKAGKRVHHSVSYTNLGMSMFEFGEI